MRVSPFSEASDAFSDGRLEVVFRWLDPAIGEESGIDSVSPNVALVVEMGPGAPERVFVH